MTDELEPQLAPLAGPPPGADPAEPEPVDARRVVLVDGAGVATIADDTPQVPPDGAGVESPAGEQRSPAPAPSYTSAEKVHALVEMGRQRLEADRSATGFAIRSVIKLAQRAGLTRQLPAWSDPEEWDALLGLFAGVAVNLMSDDVVGTFDLDAAQDAGQQVLERVFANQAT